MGAFVFYCIVVCIVGDLKYYRKTLLHGLHWKSEISCFILLGYSQHASVQTSCSSLVFKIEVLLPCTLTHLFSVSIILSVSIYVSLLSPFIFQFVSLPHVSLFCSCLCACQHHQLNSSGGSKACFCISTSSTAFVCLLLGTTCVLKLQLLQLVPLWIHFCKVTVMEFIWVT